MVSEWAGGRREKVCLGYISETVPRARYDLFLSEAPKGLRVVFYVKFTQESENPFLMIIQVDLRHEILLQSEVPP